MLYAGSLSGIKWQLGWRWDPYCFISLDSAHRIGTTRDSRTPDCGGDAIMRLERDAQTWWRLIMWRVGRAHIHIIFHDMHNNRITRSGVFGVLVIVVCCCILFGAKGRNPHCRYSDDYDHI